MQYKNEEKDPASFSDDERLPKIPVFEELFKRRSRTKDRRYLRNGHVREFRGKKVERHLNAERKTFHSEHPFRHPTHLAPTTMEEKEDPDQRCGVNACANRLNVIRALVDAIDSTGPHTSAVSRAVRDWPKVRQEVHLAVLVTGWADMTNRFAADECQRAEERQRRRLPVPDCSAHREDGESKEDPRPASTETKAHTMRMLRELQDGVDEYDARRGAAALSE